MMVGDHTLFHEYHIEDNGQITTLPAVVYT
jgi:hypothetical protein